MKPRPLPMPFDVIWRTPTGRLQITTHSRREAQAIFERKQRAGLEPSVFLGHLELEAA